MKRTAAYHKVWKNKRTGKIEGATIEIENANELRDYEQVPRPAKVAEIKGGKMNA